MKKQLGFSLSELLISLLLTSIIMTTLTQLYLSSKRQYLEAEAILEARFDLQWVSDLLSDSIRRAGFTPCLGIDQLQLVDRRHNDDSMHSLNIENQPQELIQINRMSEEFAKIIRIESPTELIVPHSAVFHEQRSVLIADCEHAEVHDLFSIHGSLLTLNKPLLFSYAASTYIGEFLEERWFIKKNAKGRKTLHYQLLHTEEVTPLIHTLQSKSQPGAEKQFLEVVMGLDEGKTRTLKVAVRGS